MKIVKWGYLLLFLSMQLTCFAPKNEFYEMMRDWYVSNTLKEIEKEQRIKLLLKTLRFVESRERYDISGKSSEYGAYQFTRASWRDYCVRFFGERLDICNPINQDLVAAKKIELFIDAGFTDAEIFSLWNCGSPKWEGKVGINQWGVAYNVPAYVHSALTTLNTITNERNHS